MENASKALLIAGGVLIAMVIASFGVYLYGVFHSHSENLLAAMSEKEVNEFNAKFQAFENRELTANELISILNLARENNHSNENKIVVNSGDWTLLGRYDMDYIINEQEDSQYQKDCNEFLKNNINRDIVYGCKEFKYNSSGLISEFTIFHTVISTGP